MQGRVGPGHRRSHRGHPPQPDDVPWHMLYGLSRIGGKMLRMTGQSSMPARPSASTQMRPGLRHTGFGIRLEGRP